MVWNTYLNQKDYTRSSKYLPEFFANLLKFINKNGRINV